jgi:hypothetical protein
MIRHAAMLPLLLALGAVASVTSPARAGEVDRKSGEGTAVAALPTHLSETGLFAAGSVTEISPRATGFSPQYPLWSDGATKRRWISLPPGTAIDASNPDAWVFPVGTKLWKEFSMGRRVETRFIEHTSDGEWRFASYVWNGQGTDAVLAPGQGTTVAVAGARNGQYKVPGEYDCRACHEGAAVPVLGFSALQLSSDRDPMAPHADPAASIDLRQLVAQGLVRNLPKEILESPPRIDARSPVERAALGYLHANCGNCHSVPSESGASVPVGIVFAQQVQDSKLSVDAVRRSLIEVSSRFRDHATPSATRVVEPGQFDASMIAVRMKSRDSRVQMPPLGTATTDDEALALIGRWINTDINQTATQEEMASWKAVKTMTASTDTEPPSH